MYNGMLLSQHPICKLTDPAIRQLFALLLNFDLLDLGP